MRLENSFYKPDDKDDRLDTLDAIFADSDYRDADYYRDYPTIFHLKYALIKDEVPNDGRYARKVYLALLNYFKRRGHFLNEGLSGSNAESEGVWQSFVTLCQALDEELELYINHDSTLSKSFEDIFSDSSLPRSARREKLMELLGLSKKDNPKEFIVLGAICGLKTDLLKLFSIGQKVDVDFSSADYETELPNVYSVIGENFSVILDSMKCVYDAGVLAGIMSGTDYEGKTIKWLSQSRVNSYEKHKRDLKLLKSCIRKYCGDAEYDFIFREDEDGTYSAYVHSVNSGNKVRRGKNLHKSKKSGERYDNLKKRIKKDLEPFSEDENVAYILNELKTDTFLPKQLTFANGVIPNQLHEREVRKILDNASKYLPFLNDKDESGLTNAEKIISLFTFRLPYFIGPVSQNYKGNGWAVRRKGSEETAVYPWNIEKVIDYDSTRKEFITRMVRECSYIAGEKVLPKESMEYQAFMVLNTINNIKVKGEKISCSLKQDIYHDLFEKNSKITKNKIAKYLNEQRGINVTENEIDGIDTVIGCQLSTYRRFYGLFGNELSKDSVRHMVEDIVFNGTVYGDSKQMFEKLVKEKYSDRLSEEQLKQILRFKYRDWGNLSKELLELEGVNKATDEITSLIRALWEDEDNLNFEELRYSDKYDFEEKLKNKHKECLKTISEFTFEDLDEMYFSAPVKRMVWQTLLIIREVTEIMGCPPKKIFVEMTRSEDEKKGDAGRKDSREKELLDLYKKEDRSWDKEIWEAGASGKLRSKKMYLYYKQMGKDMYTGLPIDLNELFDDNKYDIDHIYPRHYVKDDSIHNNLVLVDKRKNSRKSDNYPIDISIRGNKEIVNFWKMLHEKKFINDEKYRRLTGSREFSEEQKADFISRQLVETSQATKGVNDLLREIMPKKTTIVYSKAENVTDFRRNFKFYKSRLINDFHHAHDAYLNIVVGNIYYTKFNANPMNFVKNENKEYNLGRMFERDVVRNGYTAWVAPIYDKQTHELKEMGELLSTVKKMMAKNTPLLTRLSTTQHGAVSDATICSASKATSEGYLPVKNKKNPKLADVTKYGGFNSIKIAYYFLVEHEIEGKGKDKGKMVKIRTIECLPVYKRDYVESNEDGLYQYCLELGLKNPSVRVKKIKTQSLVKVDGFPLYLSNVGRKQITVANACNLIMDSHWNWYTHIIYKCNSYGEISDKITIENNVKLYDEITSKFNNGIFSKKPNSVSGILENGRNNFLNLDIKKQLYVLTQILSLFEIGTANVADLREIGGGLECGKMQMDRKISGHSEFKLINCSPTGLYTKEVDLLTV